MEPGPLTLHGVEQFQGARRCLCAFDAPTTIGAPWTARPQLPFNPRGLVIYGAPLDARLHAVMIGRDYQIGITSSPIPVRWFMEGKTFAEIVKLLDEGKELPSWADWSRCPVGAEIRITLTTRDGIPLSAEGVDVLMWGVAMVAW